MAVEYHQRISGSSHASRTLNREERNRMKSSLRIVTCIFPAAIAVIWLSASLPAADKPDGSAIYKQKCSMCHGPDGKGFPAIKTPNLTDPKWQTSVPDKDMVDVIKNGKKGTPMPAFADKLKDDEIQAVIKYIRSFDSSKKK